jgi:micrococcal nuclease
MILAALVLSATLVTLDGDTFVLDGETIRIANIDAPETLQAKCDAELRLGHVAAARLDQLLRSGPVTVSRGDPVDGRTTDRHGRTLAIVSVNGKDAGRILIFEELARPWTGKRQPWCN